MSNIEHLFENAIDAIENDMTRQEWMEREPNKTMLNMVCATSMEIWSMAVYAVTTYRDGVRRELMDQYGYDVNDI